MSIIIKLEFSEDDTIAQKYLGEALVNMARHRESGEALSYDQQVGRTERTQSKEAVEFIKQCEEFESAPEDEVKQLPDYLEKYTTSGYVQLPWDERIHSSGKTQNQDGSWMKRKKPKDMTKEQWVEYVEEVEAELTTLMSIPVEEPLDPKLDQTVETVETADTSTECDTQDATVSESEDTSRFDVSNTVLTVNDGDVTDMADIPKPLAVANDVETQQVDDTVTIPKPPVINQDDQPAPPPPPVTDVAPVGNTPDAVEDVKPMTFVQLVQRMSAKCNGDVTKSAKIKDAIKVKYDVEFAALVKRPDLIPQIGIFLDTIEV